MVIIFHKIKNITDEELIKIGITSMGQNIYFMLEQKIDSNEKYLLLYKFIMDDNVVPVSWKYFLDFIGELPMLWENKKESL